VELERSATAVLLGLPGFVLLAVSEYEGELEQAIETTADLVGCPACGAVAALHDRRPVRVRDLPCAGRPVTLIWVKRVWRCRHRLCEVGECLINGVTGHGGLVRLAGDDAAFEGDGEGVEGRLPSGGPACPAASGGV
jgi:hypothetical protein